MDSTRPLALYARQHNAMRLAALDIRAEARGLFPGQALSDARAMCPGLVAREMDWACTRYAFEELAHWHANASPVVAVIRDWADFGDLVLDITGVTHLFGGAAAMLDRLTARLRRQGIAAQGAVAPSVGAALALSHYAAGTVIEDFDPPSRLTPTLPAGIPPRRGEGWLEAALADLPVAALRLDAERIAGLRQMGLKSIGQLYGRDRAGLRARFGADVLKRLDQALGHIEERLDPLVPVMDFRASRQCAEPLVLADDVLAAADDLAERLAGQLGAAGQGAQGFHLELFRADHKVMRLSVNAARATRDAGHVKSLIANRIDRLRTGFDAGFGIEALRLSASAATPLDAAQAGVFGAPDGAADIGRLVDRLASRLGPQAVLRSKYVNTHIPERAVVLEPAVVLERMDAAACPAPDALRPVRLLPAPEEIRVMAEAPDAPPALMEWRHRVYRFARAAGPERIAAEWWRPDAAQPVRDYYSGEDGTGRRFWLFRLGLYGTGTPPRWFLHGLFA